MARSDGSRLVAVVEYDGTEYLGFQIQRTGRTVQGEIERALAEITGRHCRIVGAGRTDAGVHARGQVVHFTPTWQHAVGDLHRALNAVLARDVAVVDLCAAPAGFHARYSARSREYVYSIDNRTVRSPLAQRYAHHVSTPLDAQAMDRACACLVGEHDFLAFGWAPGAEKPRLAREGGAAGVLYAGRGTVRQVLRAGCRREDDLVLVMIEADAFLRSMVRRIVGNLLLVGSGDLSAEEFKGLLRLGHRRTPGVAVPGQGLCLVRVNY